MKKVIDSFIDKYLHFTIHWSILLCSVFPVFLGLGYIDEFMAFSVFGVMLFRYLNNGETIPLPIKIYFIFVCFYFIYSVLLSVNVISAIFFDVIQQSKPFVAFWGVYYLWPSFSDDRQLSLRNLSIIVSFIVVVVLLVLGSEDAILFFTGHESGYGGLCLLVAIFYYYYSNRTRKDVIIFFVILSLGLISGKSKFYGEFCVAVYLFFFCKNKIRLSLKTIASLTILLIGVVFVTKEKFDIYFVRAANDEADDIARVVLYYRSFDVLSDYFPLGAGFGTYACFASSKYYSPLYYKYGMDSVYGLEPDPQNGNFVADTYYPSIIGEFGPLGCILLICFWKNIIKKIYENFDDDGNLDNYRLGILLVSTFLIEGIAGPLMLANVGVPLMMVLGFVLCKSKHEQIMNLYQEENSYPKHIEKL